MSCLAARSHPSVRVNREGKETKRSRRKVTRGVGTVHAPFIEVGHRPGAHRQLQKTKSSNPLDWRPKGGRGRRGTGRRERTAGLRERGQSPTPGAAHGRTRARHPGGTARCGGALWGRGRDRVDAHARGSVPGRDGSRREEAPAVQLRLARGCACRCGCGCGCGVGVPDRRRLSRLIFHDDAAVWGGLRVCVAETARTGVRE